MLKNYFSILFVVLLSSNLFGQTEYTITHNLGTDLSRAQEFHCGPYDRVARHFELASFGISEEIEVSSIDIGIFQMDAEQTITVNIYATDASFPAGFDPATANLLGTEEFYLDPINVHNADFMAQMRSYDFTTPVVIPAGVTHIVAEYVVPVLDDLGDPIDAIFLPAQGAGTGEPGYYTTDGCGGPYPMTASVDLFGVNFEYFISLDAFTTTLSADEFELQELVSIYPNPAKDFVNVNLSGNVQIERVNVYNMLGAVQSVELINGQIDLSKLNGGVYFIEVQTSSGTVVKRVIKN